MMFTAHTKRSAQLPTHLGTSLRRSVGGETGRLASRDHHGTGRSLRLDIEHLASLSAVRGSMFDTAAPERR